MGRQTGLHMLEEDCKALLDTVHNREPVLVIDWSAATQKIEAIQRPWQHGGLYCIWNQALLPAIQRKFIPESNHGPYYRVDSALPVIELSYPRPVPESWNERSALKQGRIWAEFGQENREFERWFNSIVRWIRKNFVKNPVPHLGGYVGPAAYAWYKAGGVLLPALKPPITAVWLSWVEAQDQHRSVFAK
jgi:hypothetical protein